MKHLFLLGCIAAWAGCSEGHPTGPASLAGAIDVQTAAPVMSSVSFTVAGGFAQPSAVSMTIAEPLVKLHVRDDKAELDAITLPLGDVTIPASALPPKGLILRNLVVKAPATKAAILHAQDDALELRANLPLSLDWSMQLDDGTLYPLGTVHTEPVNVDVQVVRSGGHVIATVQAACLGTCWAVDGVAKLSDGALYLEADADVNAAK